MTQAAKAITNIRQEAEFMNIIVFHHNPSKTAENMLAIVEDMVPEARVMTCCSLRDLSAHISEPAIRPAIFIIIVENRAALSEILERMASSSPNSGFSASVILPSSDLISLDLFAVSHR